MKKITIAGVDPGFANIGLCLIDLFVSGEFDLICTKLVLTSASKKKVGQIDDEIRRLSEIEDAIIEFLDEHNPDVLVMEEPGKCLMKRKTGWATNPTLLRTSSLMWGAAHAICRARGIYCIKVGSQAIKVKLCEKRSASKAEVEKAVKERFPDYDGWPTTKKIEHVCDAVGAVITGSTDPAVMVNLRKLKNDA